MSVAIVDYNAGNLRSVQRACQAGGVACELVKDPDVLRRAERIVFPGVGHAESAMRTLGESGLDASLREAHRKGTPILGICVGAQLILESSEESRLPCLGLMKGVTRRFALDTRQYKIPHIGWNQVTARKPHPLLEGLRTGDEFYFVHSYYPDPTDPECVMAESDYGGPFCCAVGRDNLFATQFHPEKSGPLGLQLLKRFSTWEGTAC